MECCLPAGDSLLLDDCAFRSRLSLSYDPSVSSSNLTDLDGDAGRDDLRNADGVVGREEEVAFFSSESFLMGVSWNTICVTCSVSKESVDEWCLGLAPCSAHMSRGEPSSGDLFIVEQNNEIHV